MTITRLSLGVASLVVISSSATAALVVDRGLPTANLNNISGANRSNVTWGYGQSPEQYFTGDDFTLGATGDINNPTWQITKITTWTTGGTAGDLNFFMGDRFSNVRLFVGGASGISEAAAGNFALGQDQTDNANITFTRTTYQGGENYQTTSGAQAQLWKVEFTGLAIDVNPGDMVQLGITGTARNAGFTWFNHASNAALSGSTQQGSDDLMRYHNLNDLVAGSGTWDSLGNGWDKSSDMNMLVEAQAVPEPATMTILGLGVAAFAARRKKKN